MILSHGQIEYSFEEDDMTRRNFQELSYHRCHLQSNWNDIETIYVKDTVSLLVLINRWNGSSKYWKYWV